MTESGIFASRSICSGSTCSSRNALRLARNRSPFSTAIGSSGGWGWIRSRRKLPRNNSLPKLGSFHSASRAASTTSLASCSVTVTAIEISAPLPSALPAGPPGRRGLTMGSEPGDPAAMHRQARDFGDLGNKHGRKVAPAKCRAYGARPRFQPWLLWSGDTRVKRAAADGGHAGSSAASGCRAAFVLIRQRLRPRLAPAPIQPPPAR
jgi:hypothetical protein